MPRFFIENVSGDAITVSGQDAAHISRSLRMKTGDTLTVCGGQGVDYLCVIESVTDSEVFLRVTGTVPTTSEPSVRLTLYQGLPKGDKLELVIEKTVELGIHTIVPVLMQRSVSRPDAKAATKKLERYRKLALSAAKQCGRGIVPTVSPMIDFRELPGKLASHQSVIFFYECGGQPLSAVMDSVRREKLTDIAIVIGPEGGFAPAEAQALQEAGAVTATLGRRILRTETAPIAATAAIMFATGNMDT